MTTTFAGLDRAVGLTDAQRSAVSRLLKVQSDVMARNEEKRAYYEGDVTVEDFGMTMESERVANDNVCHWPEKAVDSLAERECFDGFVFDGQYDDDDLRAAMAANDLVSAYRRYNVGKLMHGVMFACVTSTPSGPKVRFHSAETAWAEPDGNYDSGDVGCGIAIARYGRLRDADTRTVPVQVNLYERGAITEITRTAEATWTAERKRMPHDECMMYAFVHKSTGTKPFGQSRITKPVMSYTRNAMRASWHMALSGAFYAMPKYAALGLTDAQFDAMMKNKPKFYMDTMMLFTRDKDGSVPQLQKFDGSSPSPFIEELEYYATQFCGATGVPMSQLVDTGHYTSSDAMAAAANTLVIAAKDDIQADKRTLRKIALMLMAIQGNTVPDRLSPEQMTVQAHFLAPDMPSRAQMADSTLKNINAFPWLADTDYALEQVGMEQADIMRVRPAREEYAAAAALDALVSTAMPQQAAEVDDGGQ